MTTPKNLNSSEPKRNEPRRSFYRNSTSWSVWKTEKRMKANGTISSECHADETSTGQSAIASAAYRSGEKLYSEYYGEYVVYCERVE